MSFFKDHVVGIFVLGAVASVAASYVYEYLTKKYPHLLEDVVGPLSASAPAARSSTSPGPMPNKTVLTESVAPATQAVVRQLGPTTGMDIWTTSVYSYAPGGGGPGGGLRNEELVVGGWGDNYFALIQFKLDGLPTKVASASLELFCFKSKGTGTVGMLLDRIVEPWDWTANGTGPDRERLWWSDRPKTTQWRSGVLPPCTIGTWYKIDITDLYGAWVNGSIPNYGVQLRPLRNDNRWNEFYSSR
jgi:hypothetical protein